VNKWCYAQQSSPVLQNTNLGKFSNPGLRICHLKAPRLILRPWRSRCWSGENEQQTGSYLFAMGLSSCKFTPRAPEKSNIWWSCALQSFKVVETVVNSNLGCISHHLWHNATNILEICFLHRFCQHRSHLISSHPSQGCPLWIIVWNWV